LCNVRLEFLESARDIDQLILIQLCDPVPRIPFFQCSGPARTQAVHKRLDRRRSGAMTAPIAANGLFALVLKVTADVLGSVEELVQQLQDDWPDGLIVKPTFVTLTTPEGFDDELVAVGF
jgi:hypothetical protein